MRTVVIGYGSIGARHARVLREEGCDVGVVSRREVDFVPRYGLIAEAVERHRPEYVIVATRTVEHRETLEELARLGFEGVVLVEKPILADSRPVPDNRFAKLLVGYNLRFHPGVQELRRLLREARILSVTCYVGQHLPLWRPDRDYREVYSAHSTAGGGVIRDLSHELDFLNWILGGWTQVSALGGHLSSLEIDSEDTAVLLASFRGCPAAGIQLNYLDRVGRRFVLANTDDHTLALDLIQDSLQIDGERRDFYLDQDTTYREQHRAILEGRDQDVCTVEEAFDVVRLVEATEEAMRTFSWVAR